MIESRTERRAVSGRLRALAWLVAVPLAIGSTSGCALETDEQDEDETAEIADELSKAGGVEVVQCNPYYAGAYERPDRKSPRNWATAKRFARMLDRSHPRAAVIGMQEIESAEDAEQMRAILAAETGRRWSVRWFHKQKTADALPACEGDERLGGRSDVANG